MPRTSDETAALLAGLRVHIDSVIAAARRQGHDDAMNEIRSLVSGSAPVKRGPGRPRGSKNASKSAAAPAAAKPVRKKRKSSWAGLTAEQRLARVNPIRKGKGAPPPGEEEWGLCRGASTG